MATIDADNRHSHDWHITAPIKWSVRAATTANVTISTGLNAGDTIDGVTLAAGDRVLVKDQSTGADNGIYSAGASPARVADWSTDEPGAYLPGGLVLVREGTVGAGTLWRCTNTTAVTVGVTAVTFAAVGGAGATALDDLTDVTITAPAEDDTLRYVGGVWVNDDRRWEPVTTSGGGWAKDVLPGFIYDNPAAALGSTNMRRWMDSQTSATYARPYAPFAGRVVGVSWRKTAAISAGTATLSAFVVASTTTLVTLTSASANAGHTILGTPVSFAAGDPLGINIATDGSYAPTTLDFTAELAVEYGAEEPQIVYSGGDIVMTWMEY